MKAKRLGRGLSGLISRTDRGEDPADEAPDRANGDEGERAPGQPVVSLPTDAIRPNPYQPRTAFDGDDLAGLEASIREHGILQPLVVRRSAAGHELIAGERRLRAARKLRLAEVPVVVRAATDEEMKTLAPVENLQRVDLNAMEKARALRSMMRNFGLTQEAVAARVGKARTTIANIVRLLDLPDGVQSMVEAGVLTGAQARAVLQADGAERRIRLAEGARTHGWSVREIERRARQGPTVGRRRKPETADPYVQDLEQRRTRALGTRVTLHVRKGREGGTIEIAFHDNDVLDGILEKLEA